MNASPPPPRIAVTMGDPGGIGPEVVVRALADRGVRCRGRFVLFASQTALMEACDVCGIEPFWWRVAAGSSIADAGAVQDVLLMDIDEGPIAPAPHEPSAAGGRASLVCIDGAFAACRRDDALRCEAIVTGPISKTSWRLAGGRYPGHTELLASAFGVKRVVMMFVSPRLRVVLATIHLALMDVREALTIGRIFDAIDLGAEGCRSLGVQRPRVAVCGLNPHAGEGGLFGDEEGRLIEPAIRLARQAGIKAFGPFPADTIFTAAVAGNWDLVVAMYHDQGLIPVKLLDRDRAVNMTVGLPIVRTSPDHGTAFDIAGTGRADPGSMRSAIDLALYAVEQVS